jgi:hypothetical protein
LERSETILSIGQSLRTATIKLVDMSFTTGCISVSGAVGMKDARQLAH